MVHLIYHDPSDPRSLVLIMASDEDLEGDFNGSISVDLHDTGDL